VLWYSQAASRLLLTVIGERASLPPVSYRDVKSRSPVTVDSRRNVWIQWTFTIVASHELLT
jgi:hypothetical protein